MGHLSYDTAIETTALYIHWPFCPYKCNFCPFVAIAGHDQYMQVYHKALVGEIEQFARACYVKSPIRTLFFGGGTPSTYPNELLLDMFGTLEKEFNLSELAEVTIEVNPGTVTYEKLLVWKKAGINRLSIGVQSLKDAALHALNRKQNAQDVLWLIPTAATLFDNISIDLIVGLPGINPQEWKELMETIVTWPITHVSMYFLDVHEDTPLYFKVQSNKVTLPVDDQVVDSYRWSVDWLRKHNFEQYEISNFARPGFKAMHNSIYWERRPYKGFGLGACSFDGQRRFQNQKNLMKYVAMAPDFQELHFFAEELTLAQRHREQVMLGLRCQKGMRLNELCIHNNADHYASIEKQVRELEDKQLIRYASNRIIVSPAGLAVQNEIAVRLICE